MSMPPSVLRHDTTTGPGQNLDRCSNLILAANMAFGT
jgi:hypothetical protein